jgi:predicted P-loop ATPase
MPPIHIKKSNGADKTKAPDAPTGSTVNETNAASKSPGKVIELHPEGSGNEQQEDDWRDLWTRRKDRPVNNLENVMIALRNAPALKNSFAFDEMLLATLVNGPLPGSNDIGPHLNERLLSDPDVTRVQEYLQTQGLSQIGSSVVHQAIDLRGRECAFHPVRDYLNSLVWDGKPRVGAWLSTYLGAASGPYTEGVGRMFLIAMVARIDQPGCKCDYTIILEGPQGSEKSTACKILGGMWFSDGLPEVSGKDAALHLAGKWLIELGEMAVMGKWESTSLKAFLTRQEDKYRPAYGRKEIVQKRQCVFIGTTNQPVYLKDSTGGRRFWPVPVGKIDNAALAHDRNQLFAEAVKLYKSGEKWHPDSTFEKMYIQPEQEARFEADSWEDLIRAFVHDEKRTRVGTILLHLGIDPAQRSTRNERRVTDVLQRLGWRRDIKKDADGNRSWSPPI